MIDVTRLNGKQITINSDHIEFIEETPDTVVTLQDGKKILVKESKDEVVDLIIAFRKEIQNFY